MAGEYEEKLKKFIALYNANIGVFPGKGKDELVEWMNVVSRVPLDKMHEFIQELGRGREGKAKPLVPACWRVYNEMFRPRQNVDKPPAEHCGLCNSTGWMWAVGRYEKGADGKVSFEPSCNPNAGALITAVIECVCSVGERRVTHKTDMALRSRMHNFRSLILPKEALASGFQSDGTVEVQYTNHVIRESNRTAEAPEPPQEPMQPEVDEALAMAMQAQQVADEEGWGEELE